MVPGHWIWSRFLFAVLLLFPSLAGSNTYVILHSLLAMLVYGAFATVTHLSWEAWLHNSTETCRRKQKTAVALFIGFNCLSKILFSALLILLTAICATKTALRPNLLLAIARVIIGVYVLVIATAVIFPIRFADKVIPKYYRTKAEMGAANRWSGVIAAIFILVIAVVENSALDFAITLSFVLIYGTQMLFAAILEFYQLGVLALADVLGELDQGDLPLKRQEDP
jgi:hypothetical protein